MKNYVIYILVGISGIGMLVHSLFNEYENNKIRTSNKLITGTVEKVEKTSDSGMGEGYRYYVGYKINENNYLVSGKYDSPVIKYVKGDIIKVLYQSSNPQNAIFKEDLYSPFIILEFIIDLLLSLVLFIGIYQYKKSKKVI